MVTVGRGGAGGGASRSSFERIVINGALGFMASVGFGLSGMANSDHIRHFFDLKRLTVGKWDPALLFTFVAALGSHLFLYQMIIMKKMNKPLYASSFDIPTRKDIDHELIVGAFLFGAGWAIGGFCPGPAITAAFAGNYIATVFLTSLFIGWIISYYFLKRNPLVITNDQLLSLLGVGATLAFAYYNAKSNNSLFSFFNWEQPIDSPLAGGTIIGVTAALMMGFTGRIFGISGIVSTLVFPEKERSLRPDSWLFFIGLILGSQFLVSYMPKTLVTNDPVPIERAVISGLIVGVGTNLGNGCTSGHGIRGISRFSTRSFVATGVFFVTNIIVSTYFL